MANMEWDEIYGEYPGDTVRIASYESEPFPMLGPGDTTTHDETTTVVIHVVGSDDDGYILTTHDTAYGPIDDAGREVYRTRGDAIRAAEKIATERGGGLLPLIGIDAEAYSA